MIFQPDELTSYYLSYGTSYNTSGDTYQFGNPGATTARTANTDPEKSRNIEVGGKFELFERRALLGVAAFYSQKYNERNTDPDTAAAQELLSGKRHATGMEFNLAGRLTPNGNCSSTTPGSRRPRSTRATWCWPPTAAARRCRVTDPASRPSTAAAYGAPTPSPPSCVWVLA